MGSYQTVLPLRRPDSGPERGSAGGDMGGDRPGRGSLDNPGGAHEGGQGAPGSIVG